MKQRNGYLTAGLILTVLLAAAIVVILAFWVVLSGTLADLINRRIDPRLRLGGEG